MNILSLLLVSSLISLLSLVSGGKTIIYPGMPKYSRHVDVNIGGGDNKRFGPTHKTRKTGSDQRWAIYGDNVGEWPMELGLSGKKYGFADRRSPQEISLTVRANCRRGVGECDLFVVFAFGENRYISFATDLDGGFWSTPSGRSGIQVYPACGRKVAKGNGLELLNNIPSTANLYSLRSALAGGDYNNWYPIDSGVNGEEFPITFLLINNIKKDRITLKFASETFPNGLTCTYKGAMSPDKALRVLFSPDWDNGNQNGPEIIGVATLTVNGNRWKDYGAPDDELEEADDGYSIGDIDEVYGSETKNDGDDDFNEDDWDWDYALSDEEIEMFKADNMWQTNDMYGWDIRSFVLLIIGILIGGVAHKYYAKCRAKKVFDNQPENRPLLINMQ